MVTLFSGDDSAAPPFTVPREYACAYSPVLNAAFNSNFTEGQNQQYRFQDINDGVLQLFVVWLYTQRLDTEQKRRKEENFKKISSEEQNTEYLNLAMLWVLAEKMLIPRLQNLVLAQIDWIFENSATPYRCFDYVYRNTSDDSPLRRYFVQISAERLTPGQIKLAAEHFPKEMLVHIFERLAIERKGFPLRNLADYEVAIE